MEGGKDSEPTAQPEVSAQGEGGPETTLAGAEAPAVLGCPPVRGGVTSPAKRPTCGGAVWEAHIGIKSVEVELNSSEQEESVTRRAQAHTRCLRRSIPTLPLSSAINTRHLWIPGGQGLVQNPIHRSLCGSVWPGAHVVDHMRPSHCDPARVVGADQHGGQPSVGC